MRRPESPTERTPLLRTNNIITGSTSDYTFPLPSLDAVERDLHQARAENSPLGVLQYVHTIHMASRSASVSLSLLLCLREILRRSSQDEVYSREPYTGEVAQQEITIDSSTESLQALAVSEWTNFTIHASDEEIQDALWIKFPLNNEASDWISGLSRIYLSIHLRCLNIRASGGLTIQ